MDSSFPLLLLLLPGNEAHSRWKFIRLFLGHIYRKNLMFMTNRQRLISTEEHWISWNIFYPFLSGIFRRKQTWSGDREVRTKPGILLWKQQNSWVKTKVRHQYLHRPHGPIHVPGCEYVINRCFLWKEILILSVNMNPFIKHLVHISLTENLVPFFHKRYCIHCILFGLKIIFDDFIDVWFWKVTMILVGSEALSVLNL